MRKKRKIFVIETPGVEGNENFNMKLRLMKNTAYFGKN